LILSSGEQGTEGAVDANYTPVGGVGSLAYARRGDSYQVPHKDHLGGTRELTDASGAVTQYYEYDAFGTKLEDAGGQTNRFQFAANYMKLKDHDNIYLSPTRVYHAGIGRFLQWDKIPAAVNRYVFAVNNPCVYIDPYGQQAKPTATQQGGDEDFEEEELEIMKKAWEKIQRKREEEEARLSEQERTRHEAESQAKRELEKCLDLQTAIIWRKVFYTGAIGSLEKLDLMYRTGVMSMPLDEFKLEYVRQLSLAWSIYYALWSEFQEPCCCLTGAVRGLVSNVTECFPDFTLPLPPANPPEGLELPPVDWWRKPE